VFVGFSLGAHERKRPLGRPRRRWENNIKIDLRETPVSDLLQGFMCVCTQVSGSVVSN
jgi:hypothetical protein